MNKLYSNTTSSWSKQSQTSGLEAWASTPCTIEKYCFEKSVLEHYVR